MKFCDNCGTEIISKKRGKKSKRDKRSEKKGWMRIPIFLIGLVLIIGLGKYGVSQVQRKFFSTSEVIVDYVTEDTVYNLSDEQVSFDEETKMNYVNNIIVILFQKNTSEEEVNEIINGVNGKIVGRLKSINQYQIDVGEHSLAELKNISEELNKNEKVFYVGYDTAIEKDKLKQSVEPNDPWGEWFKEVAEWNVENPSGNNWGAEAIDAPGAWEYNDKFSKIKIGVIDSGFDEEHEDLEGKIKFASRFAEGINNKGDHGTHVAGIIGARDNNKKGITGVVWNSELICYDWKLSDKQREEMPQEKYLSNTMILAGMIQSVTQGAKVINLSAGKSNALEKVNGGFSPEGLDREGETFSAYMATLLDLGYDFLIVQAAGNGNKDEIGMDAINNAAFCAITEKNCSEIEGSVKKEDILNRIIIVGAVEKKGWLNSTLYHVGQFFGSEKRPYLPYRQTIFSNGGSQVDICAPGKDIYSTIAGKRNYAMKNGTSMAAPMVTSVAALVWSINKNFTGSEVKEIVCNNTKDIAEDNPNTEYAVGTYPIVNAKLAVEAALKKTEEQEIHSVNSQNGVKMQVTDITAESKTKENNIYSTSYDEDTMEYQRICAKDKNYIYQKNLYGKLERKDADGVSGKFLLYDDDFFTICGLDESYIYILKGNENATLENGVYNMIRISKDGKKREIILKDIKWCFGMYENYFYYVPNENTNCIKRLDRGTLIMSDFIELDEQVEILQEDGNYFMVVTRNSVGAAGLFGGTNYYYLVDKDGKLMRRYGSDLQKEDYPVSEWKNCKFAVKHTSNGYLRGVADEVYIKNGGNFIKIEGVSGWTYQEDGVITTLETNSGEELPYKMVYHYSNGIEKTMTEVESNQAFFTLCQDDEDNWWYFDQTDIYLILYRLSADFKDKKMIKKFQILDIGCDLESCGMEIMNNRIYFYSMPDSITANAVYRYDLLLEDN